MIGTGFARRTQIPAFLHCAGAEVVSVASASAGNAARTAAEFGIGHHTDDWRETVRRDDVDLVSITTPPDLHREMTLFALEHGKHVLCEKPMALNAAEAAEMTARAGESGRLALIDHELRFLNGRRKAYEMIREGRIGRVIHIKQTFRNASRGTQDVGWNWWSDSAAGGGVLGALGSHAVDTVRWLLGTEIAAVFGLLKTNVRERLDETGRPRRVTSDDEANLIFRLADSNLTRDATGTIALSVVEAGKYDLNCRVFGDRGSLVIGESGELWLAGMDDRDLSPVATELGDAPPDTSVGGWSRGFMAFAREIVAALREGRTEIPHAASFADGLRVQQVLDAVRRSDEEGRMISV